MYYGLTNFYQNHRRYVKSRDDNQLLGKLSAPPSTDCFPFNFNNNNDTPSKPIAPCGAIANSLFSGKIFLKVMIYLWMLIKLFADELKLHSVVMGKDVPLLNTGIAWPSDKEMKFRNPEGNLTDGTLLTVLKRLNSHNNMILAFKDYDKPPSWRKSIFELDPTNSSNNGFENEDLMVWMRTSALPTFRKLYRRVNHTAEGFISGLLKGNYVLNVKYCR